MKEQIFFYVPNARVAAFMTCGWVAHSALENTHHGEFSTLMEWTGESEPRMPEAWGSEHTAPDD